MSLFSVGSLWVDYSDTGLDLRGSREAQEGGGTGYPPITLCYWEQKYYEMGVVESEVAGHRLRIYDIERSVCDVVRFRNKVGMDVMTEVLRTYLSRKDRNIARLTEYARKMRIGSRMTQYLNVMV